MGIKIGDGNRLKKVIISKGDVNYGGSKKNFFQRHLIITGVIIAVVAGIILRFAFWDEFISCLLNNS
ncbi:hypothetical protein J0B03_05500 [Alkalibacter rhizosphaerae]|uniref:Uncharacterized protein n=1 Tax=Alkalibacter rhizosphaerae TaxID=2815577 RepID=A0A975AJA2_9FIRM|nr:hypothetical protein [Alkalibacter rhizosphaerae]QSX09519.1 hypothetical protein J0B03_05500 [Alkalibacter rhizosphaerae]